jgi:outer membrane biosynthesis protein TonB
MGTWGHGLFEDDLALDVKGTFDRAVAGGASPADAASGLMESELAREVLEEFGEGERDDMFWEENRGLFYAIASLQLEHGVLHEVVRQQTLQAIAVERRGLDPERDRERWELLDVLEAKLSGAAAVPPPPPQHRIAEGTNPALQAVEAAMAKPPAAKPAATKPAKKPAAKKPAAKKPAKKPATRKPAKKPATRKPATRKPAATKPAARKAPATKPPAKQPAPKQPAPKQAAPKQKSARSKRGGR